MDKKKEKRSDSTEKEMGEWDEEMSEEWKRRWEHRAKRGKIGFGLFILAVGVFWLLKDLGYIPYFPLWPAILIFFGLLLILTKI